MKKIWLKRSIPAIFWVGAVILLLVAQFSLLGFVDNNGLDGGFCTQSLLSNCSNVIPTHGPSIAASDPEKAMEEIIEESGGWFLRSYTFFLMILDKVEMSNIEGLDFEVFAKYTSQAIECLNRSNTLNGLLIDIAEATPYHEGVQEKLKTLDYQAFREKYNLTEVVFKNVAGYLSQGDIRGLLLNKYNQRTRMVDMLYTIQSYVEAKQMPPLADLWDLYQEYSHSLLAGQITARIFYSITG